jgi:ADP-ribosylglycohydrolase/protein-tyrosine phosphatase
MTAQGQHRRSHETVPFANSYWVAPGLLMAGPYPGDVDRDTTEIKIGALAAVGIRTVINLQPKHEGGRGGATFPDLTSRLAERGIESRRMPVRDMDIPSRAEMVSILDAIDERNAVGDAVYIHCWGGHGRTGTVVGCWLGRHGLDASDPLQRLKDLRAAAGIYSESPQTSDQRHLVIDWPSPDTIPLINRLVGSVWGALVGDALGVPYEFGPPRSPAEIVWGAEGTYGQPAGTWSDDGGLLLALLDSLLAMGFDTDDQGRRAVAWLEGPDYKPGALFDVGGTTRRALARIGAGTRAEAAGGESESDNGNGSLMRILPICLVSSGSTDALIEWAERSSSITHRHPRSRLVCALYCLTAQRLLAGELDRKAALQFAIDELRRSRDADFHEDIGKILDFSDPHGSGYVVDTFWSAWSAFESAESYEQCVRQAVAYGNDTDTTACVAGGLGGIYWGLSGIPGDWLSGMRGRDIVMRIVARLVQTLSNADNDR